MDVNQETQPKMRPVLIVAIVAFVGVVGCLALAVTGIGVYFLTGPSTPALLAPFVVDVNEPLPETLYTDTASPYTEAIVDPTGAPGFAIGNPDAEVTVVEYGDFSCPYCYQFATETDDMLTGFVEDGRVRFVFKPLTFVNPPTSVAAADASYCAALQGVFWPMHDGLWEIFEDVGAAGFAEPDLIEDAANNIEGMNVDEFMGCYTARMPEELLAAVDAEADSLDVSGTPTVFVNGERVSFNSGYAENLRQAIITALGGPDA